jgi:aspartate-semialdehyde dehydrogenase
MASLLQIAVVGGEGVVGREVLGALLTRDHPAEGLTILGSERSVGDEVEYGDDTLEIEKTEAEAFRGKDVVILATPEDTSRTLAQTAQQQGAWVIDLSDAFRADTSVPLVLPEVNPGALSSEFKGRIVTVPTPIPTAIALIAKPLLQFGISRIHVTALMGASSLGNRGVSELEKQAAALLSGKEPEESPFPHRLAFNFFPQVGVFGDDARESSEERGWNTQLNRLFGDNAPAVSGVAIQVPTFFGHGLSLLIEGTSLSAARVREAFAGNSAVKVLDQPNEKVYPMPMLVTADDAVHIGRIRDVAGSPNAVQLFAAIDNAGRGAASAAVQVALSLGERR